MPRLSVFLVRTALIHLALGFTAGGLLLLHKGVPLHPQIWRLLPVHAELVLTGWTVQLALGVAYWILPRFKHGPARGDERPIWIAYLLFNLSVLGVAVGQWLAWPGALVLAGRLGELLAVLVFARNAWPRIKPLGA